MIGLAAETAENSSLNAIKKATQDHQITLADNLEDKLYKEVRANFERDKLYLHGRSVRELLYKYELDRRPQDRSRLAYTALWLGMDDGKGAYPNLDLINQATQLAQSLNDEPLYNYCQQAIAWARYQNLSNDS